LGFSDDEEEDDEDGEVKEEDRYWEKRVARVLAKKNQGKLRWKDGRLIVMRLKKWVYSSLYETQTNARV
jgi:hypothetical protein